MTETTIITEVIYDNCGISHIIEYPEGDFQARKEAIADLRN